MTLVALVALFSPPSERYGGPSPSPPYLPITEPILTLAHLDGLELRRAADGWHGIWQVDGVKHQFRLPEAVPAPAHRSARRGCRDGARGRRRGWPRCRIGCRGQ
ncbi:hypothetical protein DPM13_12345 [Paracoccus mutanolyticus]|uniref:Uncharacterized protein n=1 Tax=Paracoccus mutanolyticus TaxID=1499308 RepID=A0ABM6WSE5_9RHOB|nr:hypothetical protein DPM13_12345 [Paracoccus mutanolyticus]